MKPSASTPRPRRRKGPVINVRKQLGWRKRFLSNASTALMWSLFIYMWRPVLHMVIWFGGLNAWMQFLQYVGLIDSPGERISLIGDILPSVFAASLFLMLWSRLPAVHTDAKAHPLDDADYARHFGIADASLATLRDTRISVVQHDDQGRIVGFDSKVVAPASTPDQP